MSIEAPPLFVLEEEVPFYTKIRQRTVVTGVEVVTPAPLPPGEYCIWASLTPVPCRVSADMSYADAPPFVLGSVAAPAAMDDAPSVLRLPLSRWEIQAGTTLTVHVAALSARSEAVTAAMAGARRRAHNEASGGSHRCVRRTPRGLEPTTEAELSPLVSVRLCGAAQAEVFDDDQVEWVPFITRRWFELADPDMAEATLVFQPPAPPAVEGRPVVTGAAAETFFSLLAGGVKEASGVDPDGAYIRWADGSIGLTEELKPYGRVFTPARTERVARVRRFPHRNADVVGELPFGTRAVAVGRHRDPFTHEDYALLLLPDQPEFTPLVKLYGLTSVSPSQWFWGWSKIAGSSRLPLLRDVTTEAVETTPVGLRPLQLVSPHLLGSKATAAGSPTTAATPLPPGTLFTPTRPTKPVRIRRRATLRSEVVGQLDANEIREAVREVTVPAARPASGSKVSGQKRPRSGSSREDEGAPATTFVEWQGGGFSVLSNGQETYLRRVHIHQTPPPPPRSSASPEHVEEQT